MKIVFYVPNVVCYFRFWLSFWSLFHVLSNPQFFLILYVSSISLDMLDGYLARKLNQTSKYGEILDVCCDSFARSSVWSSCCVLYPKYIPLLCIIIMLEWGTLAAVQCSRAIRGKYGFSWKELDEKLQQRFVAYYFENGFLNPLGMTGICGLFFSSLYAYGYSFAGDYMDQYWWMQCVGYWLFMGQGISMYIQTYFIVNFFQLLLEVDEKQKLKLANGKRRAIKAKK